MNNPLKTWKELSAVPGMRIFLTVWFGQMVSTLGSGMTQFALAVWVLQETGSTTAYGGVLFFSMFPGIVVSLVSGVLADRWDRRRQMLIADSMAAVSTFCVAMLYMADALQLWHVYAAVSVSATATAIQTPAWGAMAALLVPKEHLGRATGLNSVARSVSQITGPLVGGTLMLTIGLGGVILIDFITFFAALGCVLSVRFPAVPQSEGAKKAKGSVLSEAKYGWQYVWNFPALRAHLTWFASLNFVLSFLWVLFPPMVLSYSNAAGLGTVSACYGLGFLVGGLAMTAWGGGKRPVPAMLFGGLTAGVGMLGMGLRPSVPLTAFFLFALCFGLPILNGSFFRLWMPRIPADVQGRAISAMIVTSWSSQPLAFMLAGPVADRWFRPLLVPGGPLADSVGLVLGTGPGRGIGLLLVVGGIILLTMTAVAALSPTFAGVEENIPVVVSAPATPAPAPAPEPEADLGVEGAAPVPA